MLKGKALVKDTDMEVEMQLQAMSCASEALDLFDVLDCTRIASHIKKVYTQTHVSNQSECNSHFFQHIHLSFCHTYYLICFRNLTWYMEEVGSVWWDQALGATSHTLKGPSSTTPWALSNSSSLEQLQHNCAHRRGEEPKHCNNIGVYFF